jgi:uncharacterized protein DUF3313
MTFKTLSTTVVTALAVALAGCASTGQPDAQKYSGFLGDYSQLQPATDSAGNKFERAISPKFDPKKYHSVLIDQVRFYPEPEPTEQVSQDSLNAIRSYLNQSLQTNIGKAVPVTDRAGPGVLRVSVAITSMSSQKVGLKPYQYLPIALVATGAKRAITGTPQEANIFVEAALSDSVTGQRMVSSVRSGTGKSYTASESGQVTADSLKPLLDQWVEGAVAEVPKLVQGKR